MSLAAQAVSGGVIGLLAGLVFFRSLRRNATLYLERGAAWRPVALHLARMSLLAAVLAGVAMGSGGTGLLAAFAGILLARAGALRAARAAR